MTLPELKFTTKDADNKGFFCYAGCRINPHRYNADQLQSQLNEYNRALEYTLSFLSLPSDSTGLT